jgi:serine/threonine protein kinase
VGAQVLDLKPANLLFDEHDELFISDFGAPSPKLRGTARLPSRCAELPARKRYTCCAELPVSKPQEFRKRALSAARVPGLSAVADVSMGSVSTAGGGGTPACMAPEQHDPDAFGKPTVRADLRPPAWPAYRGCWRQRDTLLCL